MAHSESNSHGSTGDMLFGMGGKLLYAATRVALPPLALAHMGLEEYGLWAVCFVLVAYLGMAASGFTLVYLRQAAAHHAKGDVHSIGVLLSTGMISMGLLTLGLMSVLWMALPFLLHLFGVAAHQQDLARTLWIGVAGVFLADMSLGAFANVLHAIGRIRQEQKVWVAAFAFESLLIVVLLMAGLGAHGLLGAFAARYVFAAVANGWLVYRALPGLRLSPRLFDPALLRGFFSYGLGMQLSGLVATVLHSADRLLAGIFLGAQATALMDLASKLPTTAGSVGSSVSTVAVSASARHDVQAQDLALRDVYRNASRITVASLGLSLPFLAWFAHPLSMVWMGTGPTQAALAPLLTLASLGMHAHLLTGPGNAVCRGRGSLRADFAYQALRLLFLAMSVGTWWVWFTPSTPSLLGAVVLAQVAAALLFLPWSHRTLGGRAHELFSQVLVPSLALHVMAASLYAVFTSAFGSPLSGRVDALLSLIVPGMVWVLLGGAVVERSLLIEEERQRIRNYFPRLIFWRNA
jgi:O-antigen/teichoic acid export membrane protein